MGFHPTFLIHSPIVSKRKWHEKLYKVLHVNLNSPKDDEMLCSILIVFYNIESHESVIWWSNEFISFFLVFLNFLFGGSKIWICALDYWSKRSLRYVNLSNKFWIISWFYPWTHTGCFLFHFTVNLEMLAEHLFQGTLQVQMVPSYYVVFSNMELFS